MAFRAGPLGRDAEAVMGQRTVAVEGYYVVMIPLAVAGILTPAWAAAAMAASSLSVVLNSFRLRRFRAQWNTRGGPRVVTLEVVVETD